MRSSALLLFCATILHGETAGVDAIARTLMAAFDRVDIVALGEAHVRQIDSDLRIALIRQPEFAKKVGSVVIECGSATEQATLDRYIRGESVPTAELQRVWKGRYGFCDAPVYTDFLATVREVNAKLPSNAQIRVFAGDPAPFQVLQEQAIQRHGKALIVYGAAHFYLTGPPDYLASMGGDTFAGKLNRSYPGRWLSIIPIGALERPPAVKQADIEPDYRKFDQALQTQVRPVLVPLDQRPFRDFAAEEFLGRSLTTCRGVAGCRSVFQGSALKLGQMAHAGIYVGGH